MKKGITATSAAVMVVIILILIGTVSIASYNSVQNAKLLVFALEISEIQEEVTKYYKDSEEGAYPITAETYTIDLSDVTENDITQFDSETKSNNKITLYELDFESIDIDERQYGNKDNAKDVYVLSKESGKVYYLAGVKDKDITYYTQTEGLIEIKERNEAEKEVVLSKPVIASDGIVEKTLTNGEKEKYIADIRVTGDSIKTIKYEIGFIDKADAQSYFKNNGKTLYGDRIKLDGEVPVTLYAENSKGEYTIKYAGYPKIPKAFTASQIATEDEVTEGLVIYEIPEASRSTVNWSATSAGSTTFFDVQENYNQFVWVPVPDMALFQRTNTYNGKITHRSDSYTEPSSFQGSVNNQYPNEVAEYYAMMESVDLYGGFYMGRYEAGDAEATSTRLQLTTAKTVVVKRNVIVYGYIPWGIATNNIEPGTMKDVENVAGAVYLSQNMTISDKSDIVTTLCYGVQWDSTLQYITINDPIYVTDATGKGNYTGARSKTGGKDNYAICNIFDMAGNLSEWTMEAFGNPSRVTRGGYFADDPKLRTACFTGPAHATEHGASWSFRVTMHLK